MTSAPVEVVAPPSERVYGYVAGQVVSMVGDGPDADDEPQFVAVAGQVTFTPKRPVVASSD